MDAAQHIRILQLTYAAQLADSVRQFENAGVLARVTAERRAARLARGAAQATQLGIAEPAAAFTTSAALFGCADWTIAADATDERRDDDAGARPDGAKAAPAFVATARTCLLCAMVKKTDGPSPCRLYCLDPIEAMVQGLSPNTDFQIEETLYEGEQCRVRVGG